MTLQSASESRKGRTDRTIITDHDHDLITIDQDDEGREIIVLSDENGNEQEFVLVEVIAVAGSDYAVLTPLDDDEADDEEAENDEDEDEDEDSETPLTILRIEKGRRRGSGRDRRRSGVRTGGGGLGRKG
ncbi:MAG: DUF1292 domain-containing protein [Dehalococcoidia bacterium]|nr:DUF1292 domain-containing protein [Dehalococcoidia bacterium]